MTRLRLGPLLRHVGTTDATVWVETDRPGEVAVLGCAARTFEVRGHHYALVLVEGLRPGTTTPYAVTLDGETVWPLPDDPRPAPRVRTLASDVGDGGTAPELRVTFGSCRYARADQVAGDRHFDADALDTLARRLESTPDTGWPDLLLLLGDQVYADETSAATRRRIGARRDITTGPREQVADFEEYTWLYEESWTDPDVRWLLSTVPTSMIFDDHDVRDDWNTSQSWREDMQATSWWQERVVGALSSYWVHQHLGNLTPAALAADPLWARVRSAPGDVEPLLREFAAAADAEADGAKGARWSSRRDLGRTRVLVLDSRCGRILADGNRSMLSEAEFAWFEDNLAGDYDHLLVGTSLPWLLPRALHDLEAWNESLCDGTHGRFLTARSEWLRRAADLEHWASFSASFHRLAELLRRVSAGGFGPAPATVCVLSGDVHHSYVSRARFDGAVHDGTDDDSTAPGDDGAAVYQLTCSPLHNYVPAAMKVFFRAAWSRAAERGVRALLSRLARIEPTRVRWSREAGPFFGNELMTLHLRGRRATVVLEASGPASDRPQLHTVTELTLAG